MGSRWMRNECLSSRYGHDTPLPVSRMIADLGNKMQICTQRYGKRPYGVGLLVAGYDDQGPHIFQTCPSANYYDCRAMAIGARSQAARTYLEKFLNDLRECELEELVKHGLRALRDTLPNEVDLTNKNVSIAIVGKIILSPSMMTLVSILTLLVLRGRKGGAKGQLARVMAKVRPRVKVARRQHRAWTPTKWLLQHRCHILSTCISRREGVKDLCDLALKKSA